MERRVRWKSHARCGAGEKAEINKSLTYRYYLQRNNITQKQFVVGLIENEIERDLTQRAAVGETPTDSEKMAEEHTERQKTAAVSSCESFSEEVGEQYEKQESTDFSDDFKAEDTDEDEELDDEQDESEAQGMSMGM